MTARYLLCSLLALLVLAGCGGEDEETGAETSSDTSTSSTSAALQFDQVESFTLDYLEEDSKTSAECKQLEWVEDEAEKKKLAPLTGTETVEVLTCDGIAYLAYVEYADDAAATEALAPALLPYLADETVVVMPLVGIDEVVASSYLEALKGECSCGEVVQPQQ